MSSPNNNNNNSIAIAATFIGVALGGVLLSQYLINRRYNSQPSSAAAAPAPARAPVPAPAPARAPAPAPAPAPADLLTPDEIAVITETFAIIEANTDVFAETFYGNLFETTPEVRPLFVSDMQRQGRLLVSMIKSALRLVRNPESLVEAVRDLGDRHAKYGVKVSHYGPGGASLVHALNVVLKEKFTPRAQAAWVKVYTLLTNVMIEATKAHDLKAQQLTEEEIQIVIATFALVEPHADEFAASFYNRLFATADVRHLFKNSDMVRQGRLLMGMVKSAVRYIKNPETLVPVVKDLGVRHVGYGVRPEHYKPVGDALIWCLDDMFKEKFTPEIRTAWTKVYVMLSTIAIDAANEFEAARAAGGGAAAAPASAPVGKCPF